MLAKLLHTSDWHLGAKFYGEERTEEYLAFFAKLEQMVKHIKPEGLLIAGDLFDKPDPARAVVSLFEEQMARVHAAHKAMRTIIIAGNHDSGEWLESMAPHWGSLGITVVGTYQPNGRYFELSKHIIELPSCVVAAAPYPTSAVFPAEASSSKEAKYTQFIRVLTERIKYSMVQPKPLVLMAHCYLRPKDSPFYSAKDTIGVVDIPTDYAYVALGHAHSAKEMDAHHIRYCGSPWPISANEHKARSLVSVSLALGEPAKLKLKQLQNVVPLRLVPARPRETATVLRHLQELPANEALFVALNVKRPDAGPLNDRIFINEAMKAVQDKLARICAVFWTDKANAPTMTTLMREGDPAEELRHNALLPLRKQAQELMQMAQGLTDKMELLSGSKTPRKLNKKCTMQFVQQAYQGLVQYLQDQRMVEVLNQELYGLRGRMQSPAYQWEERLIERMQAEHWLDLLESDGNSGGVKDARTSLINRAVELAGGVWRIQQMEQNLEKRKEDLRKQLQTKEGSKKMTALSNELKEVKKNFANIHKLCSMTKARLRIVDQLLGTSLATKPCPTAKVEDLVSKLEGLIKACKELSKAESEQQEDTSYKKKIDEGLLAIKGEMPGLWLTDLRYMKSSYTYVVAQHQLDQQRLVELQQMLSIVSKRLNSYRYSLGTTDPVTEVWQQFVGLLDFQLLKEEAQREAIETIGKGLMWQQNGLHELYRSLSRTADLFDHTADRLGME